MNQIEHFIHDHKYPVIKLEVSGQKFFLKSSTDEEQDLIEKCQINLYKILSYSRVEKRCSRAQAEWSFDEGKAKVTKVAKGLLQNFGYHDKNGVFLYPEESLFLLETNRLELKFNGKPVSVQNTYDLLLKTSPCNLNRYQIYKKMIRDGFRCIRYTVMLKKSNKVKEISVSKQEFRHGEKRKTGEDNLKQSKRCCTETINESGPQEVIQQLFETMNRNAPQMYTNTLRKQIPDYCVFMATNKSRSDYDFQLVICDGELVDKASYSEEKPTTYAICTEDNIAFYKLANINLPIL